MQSEIEFNFQCFGVDADVLYGDGGKMAFVPVDTPSERIRIKIDLRDLYAAGSVWYPCPMADCDIFIVPQGEGLAASCGLCQGKTTIANIINKE